MTETLNHLTVKSNETVNTKLINNNEDWLSFHYEFEHPVIVDFKYNNSSYHYEANSVCDLYQYILSIVKDKRSTVNVLKQRLLCAAIKTVLFHNNRIKDKLLSTHGLCIKEVEGITTYTMLLMLIREQMRLNDGLAISIDVKDYKNPIHHLYGNVLDTFPDTYFLPSTLVVVPDCSTELCGVDLDRSTIALLCNFECAN